LLLGYVGGVIASDIHTLRHYLQQFQQIRIILSQLPQLPATCSPSFFYPTSQSLAPRA